VSYCLAVYLRELFKRIARTFTKPRADCFSQQRSRFTGTTVHDTELDAAHVDKTHHTVKTHSHSTASDCGTAFIRKGCSAE
jgi:hypothetical protein